MTHDAVTNDLLRVAMGCVTAFHAGLTSEPLHHNTVVLVRSVMGDYSSDAVLMPLLGLTLTVCRTLADYRGETVEQTLASLGAYVSEFTSQDQED